MVAVIAQVAAGDAPLGLDDLIADPIEEGPVMADDHQGTGLADQVVLEPLDRLDVQVVRRFVQQQQVRLLEEHLAQGNPHLPAARVVRHELLGPLRGEADGGQQLVDAGIELIAMEALKSALQPAEFMDELVEVIGVVCGLLGGHLLFHLALAVEHLGGLAEGLEELLTHRARQIDVKFLLEVDDAGFPLLHHLPTAGLL